MSLGTSGTLFANSDTPVVDPAGNVAAFCGSTACMTFLKIRRFRSFVGSVMRVLTTALALRLPLASELKC